MDYSVDGLGFLSYVGGCHAFETAGVEQAVGDVGGHGLVDDRAASGDHTSGERFFVVSVFFVGLQSVVGTDDDKHIAEVGGVGDGEGAGFFAFVEREEGLAACCSGSYGGSVGGR